MIYTVTFNPCIDYVVRVGSLKQGEINRTEKEYVYPGGKGINVSIVLKNLGIESKVLGFAAGFTGDAIEKLINDFGCECDFVKIDKGFSRINVKIKAEKETEINGQGPIISEDDLNELIKKLQELKAGDTLVLAGSIPNTLPDDVYEIILKSIENKNVRVVADATKDLLLNVLKYRPFLVKPNNKELGEMFGVDLKTDDEIIKYAKKLKEMGAENVLISMAGDGALMIDENGNILKSRPPEGKAVNSVGAGDSMVAGFLAGYMKTQDYQTAFKMGLAAGSASAFVDWLATEEQILELFKKL
ncbi:MAG: 1-phosphofructokinase [Clostridia bacterium]|nr:1-phosphofructokinase [Clostridia bacterium]